MTLVEFLRARLDEDSQIAITAAASNPGSAADEWSAERIDARDELDGIVRKRWVILPMRVKGIALAQCPAEIAPKVITHIARHDPARVVAEVDAKRRIVEAVVVDIDADRESAGRGERSAMRHRILRLLALPYVDHPDYDPAWRV